MTAITLSIPKTRFKLPKFKFPLTQEEMLVIGLYAFLSKAINGFTNDGIRTLLTVALIVLMFWDINIMVRYSRTDKMTTGKYSKSDNKFFSPNFINDLMVALPCVFLGDLTASLLLAQYGTFGLYAISVKLITKLLLRYLYFRVFI